MASGVNLFIRKTNFFYQRLFRSNCNMLYQRKIFNKTNCQVLPRNHGIAQLYTIHCREKDQAFPCMAALTDKQKTLTLLNGN